MYHDFFVADKLFCVARRHSLHKNIRKVGDRSSRISKVKSGGDTPSIELSKG
jgi:hypothetical protein